MNRLWWLGLYESVQPPVLPWLFSRDYSHAVTLGVLKGVAGSKYSTSVPTSWSDGLSAFIGGCLSWGWGLTIFWLSFGTGMGQELYMSVELATARMILIFVLWVASMFFYATIMTWVSQIN
jgi:hypothetical protein